MRFFLTLTLILVVVSTTMSEPYRSDAVGEKKEEGRTLPPLLKVVSARLVAWPDSGSGRLTSGEFRVVYTIRNFGGPTSGKFYVYAGVDGLFGEHGQVQASAGEVWSISTRPFWFEKGTYIVRAQADIDQVFGPLSEFVDQVNICDPTTSVDPTTSAAPTDFALEQNYPNPFNPTTTVEYALPQASEVVALVFNTNGQLLQTIEAGYQDVGYHKMTWNASNASAGLYFLQLKAGSFSKTIKMTLLK